ncbi:hypothetical protein JCM8208_007820 [Rhodotorula glutinis]
MVRPSSWRAGRRVRRRALEPRPLRSSPFLSLAPLDIATRTGYLLSSTTAVRLAGHPGYKRAERKPPPGQAGEGHAFTVHADADFFNYLLEGGYKPEAADAFLDLLCSRLEGWLATADFSRHFVAYNVWTVDVAGYSMPGFAPSPGLIKDCHLIMRPQDHRYGRGKGVGPLPEGVLGGVPNMRQPDREWPKHEQAFIAATSEVCPGNHKVSSKNPVLPILDNPSPRKGAFYRYNDYFTLLSHPIPDNLPPHQAATRISVWRFSWSASPTALEHEPSLRDLPAATFLLPANERDARLDAGRIANNSAANPVSGIVVACMPLSASYPVARSAPAVPTQVLGTQGKERKRDKCVVM